VIGPARDSPQLIYPMSTHRVHCSPRTLRASRCGHRVLYILSAMLVSRMLVPDVVAVGVVIDTPSSVRVSAGVQDGTGTPGFQEGPLTTLPASGSLLAASTSTGIGYANSALAYTFSNDAAAAVFSFNTALSMQYVANTFAGASASVYLTFTPTEDLDYTLSGSLNGFVIGDSYASRTATLSSGLPSLFREREAAWTPSDVKQDFSLKLNLISDGSYTSIYSSGGALSGTLTAGQQYRFDVEDTLAKVFLSTGSGEAVAAGTLSLRLTPRTAPPPASVPDSGSTMVLAGLAAAALLRVHASRRRC
jgi:hypothetical protein